MSEKTVGAPEADTAALQTTIEGKLAAMSAPDAGKIYTLDGVYPQSDGIVIITVKRYKIALSNTGVALDEYGMGGTYDPKTGSVRLEKSD